MTQTPPPERPDEPRSPHASDDYAEAARAQEQEGAPTDRGPDESQTGSGQEPSYGQHPPAYGQRPPAYGQQPPAYGQQPPAYGQQQPAYGQQPPTYGQQQPAYGYGGPPAAPPAQGALHQRTVSIGEAFRYAWQGFKANAGPWIVAALVLLVVGGIGSTIEQTIRNQNLGTNRLDPAGAFAFDPAASFVNLIFTIINFAITAALVSAALQTTDGRRLQFGDFFRVPNFLQALLAAVIMAILTTVGFILLIIPGLIVLVLGMFYLQFAIDRRLSAIDAIKASFVLVKDNLGTALLLILASIGVGLLGAIALGVGLLVAIPMIGIAAAFVYRRLTDGPVMVPGSA